MFSPIACGACIAALVVGAVVAHGTAAPGPGLDPDALSYVGAAESFARTGTYRVPTSNWTAADSTEALAHFPPGLSTAIAIPLAAGLSPVQAARLTVVVCAGASAAILFAMVADAVGLAWAAVAVAGVFATPAILSQYLSLLSEPLYLVTVLLVIAGMTALRVRPGPWTAVMTGLAAAAAVMTRYAGGAVVVVAVLWALTIRGSMRQRIPTALLVGVPTAVVGGWWVIRTMRQAGPGGIRTFSVYGGLWPGLAQGAATIRDAIVPGTGGFAWRSVAAVIGVVGLAWLVWSTARRLRREPIQAGNERARALLAATGWAAAGSAALVVVAKVIADPGIPADERMLSPLILLAELAVVISVAARWPAWNRGVRSAVGVVFGAWFAASVAWSANRVASALAEGNDLASVEWRESSTIAWVRSAAAGRVLFTNWPAPLYFHAHRATHTLPEVLDALTLHRFRDRLEHQHGLVVEFSAPSVDVASPDSLAARLQLRAVARLSDGIVWEAP